MPCNRVTTITVQDSEEWPSGNWKLLRVDNNIVKRLEETIQLSTAQLQFNFETGPLKKLFSGVHLHYGAKKIYD